MRETTLKPLIRGRAPNSLQLEHCRSERIALRHKSRTFLDSVISRMVALLYWTDMPHKDIARRMRCSVSAVSSLNRRMHVRQYAGRRAAWTCAVLEPVRRRTASV